MGRPKLVLDEEQITKLAAINCSLAEMAAVLNCDVKTLTSRFSHVIEKGRETGKMSLKRKQYEVAMSGNVTMLIWLGKIMMDQRDPSLEWKNFDNKLDRVEDKEQLIKMAEKILAEVRQNA